MRTRGRDGSVEAIAMPASSRNNRSAVVLGAACLAVTVRAANRADVGSADRSEVNSPPAPERTVILRTGEQILIRPIRPEDKEGLLDGLHRLTPESRYRRFFSPVAHLSARQLRFLTEVDHRTHEALVAIDPDSRKGIGVARFIRSTTEPTIAEAAVAVVDNWHGRGLGTALLKALAARGREEGVERFSASVLAGNLKMLQLVRRLSDSAVIDSTGQVAEVQVKLRRGGMPAGLSHAVRLTAGGEVEVDPRHPAAPS